MSIFSKLFLVMAVIGALLAMVFGQGISHAFRPQFDPKLRSNIEQFMRYVVPEFGSAPTFAKGKEVCERLGIKVRIEGKNWSWASTEEMSKMTIPQGPPHGPPPFPMGGFFGPKRKGGPPFGPSVVMDYEFKDGPGRLMATFGNEPILQANYLVITFTAAAALGLLILAYLIIRWFLSPIHPLMAGIAQISSGNLEHQIKATSSDELGRLTQTFNHMARSVRQMVQSKQQLLIDVSHEIRSPLTRAKISLELTEPDEHVERAIRDLNELEAMIQDLLESARVESQGALSLEISDAVKLASEVRDQYVGLGRKIDFQSAVSESLVNVDMLRFKSVIRNLIENAFKYSPPEQPVVMNLSEQEGMFVVDIIDSGRGIPESERGKVFEPFYRVDKSRNRTTGGFGLGLSLCKKIIDAHGGTISLSQAEPQGTRVTVRFPKA